tara:strand:- start:17866 stop:19908 length:2043 start_codon:yes stop_codon:yes gene_type:complete
MNTKRERLRLALDLAKQHVSEQGSSISHVQSSSVQENERPRSKMNRLLGKHDVKASHERTLLQRTGLVERPTFDVVADKVLGKSSQQRKPALDLTAKGDSISDIAARRIRSLRQRTIESIEMHEHQESDGYVGIEEDGRPVWEMILDQQRGRSSTIIAPELAPVDESSPYHANVAAPVEGNWPQYLRPETRMSFKQWFITDENFRATQAAEAVVDSPGLTLNPLLIVGPSQTGRSHLLHATAQAVLRRQEGPVFLLSAADFIGMEHLPKGWQETLVGSRLLVLDDADEVAHHSALANEIGAMVDYAINLGVHVMLSSKSESDGWPSSRLWELTKHAATLHMQSPKPTSMVLFARNLAQKKGLMLDDGQLASIVLHESVGWRSTQSNFDLLALALQSGREVIDGDDVTALLSNHLDEDKPHHHIEREHVEDIATRLVNSAVDTVFSDTVIGGIDLHSELPIVGNDEYNPPDLNIEEMAAQSDARHAAYMQTALEDTSPSSPSVLALHEREEHLIARKGRIEERDYGIAADLLTDLDESFDARINSFEDELKQSSKQLAAIEQKMLDLASRTPEANMNELISISDELRSMESALVEFDPEREPWPEFEEQEPVKKRTVGRVKKTHPLTALESHEPKGEWNIDAGNVDMLDLLTDGDESMHPMRKIKLGRVYEVNSSVTGEEE